MKNSKQNINKIFGGKVNSNYGTMSYYAAKAEKEQERKEYNSFYSFFNSNYSYKENVSEEEYEEDRIRELESDSDFNQEMLEAFLGGKR